MRILHTSDWHLGRDFHKVQLLGAQYKVIESLVDVVRSEAVDVVVIAGDIYDRVIPNADSVAALDNALAELRATGARIVGISGNHDSAVRVGFGERVMSEAGVVIRGDIRTAGQAVLLPCRSGDQMVAFYPIPYLEPEVARHALGVPDARSHERLLRVALDRARADRDARTGNLRSVAIIHAFVTGGEESESELKLSVGGSAEVGLKVLDGFDYVALGHLHGRQSFFDGKARYSGSLMPYSFSERNHTKGAWLVDLPESGPMTVEAVDYPLHKRLHQLRGTLQELLSSSVHLEAEDGFVHAILTDQDRPLDAMDKLRRRFPHAVLLDHQPPSVADSIGSYRNRVHAARNDLDLAVDFIHHVAGRPADDDEIAVLSEVIDDTVAGADSSSSAVA